MHREEGGTSGWHSIATHDEAAALVDTLLRLDPDGVYTRTELSDAADVPLNSLSLDGTLDAIVELGLLKKEDLDGEETRYRVADDSDAFSAAKAFDDVSNRQRADSA